MNKIDLHTHTTASDGTLRPSELVKRAREQGLKAVAITDHDTIDGVKEALSAADGIEVIPGIEISVKYEKTMHILGYYLDLDSPVMQEVTIILRRNRDKRNLKIIEALNDLCMDISMTEVEGISGGDIVGKPHIAAVLVQKGYATSNDDAFDQYLERGRPAHVEKEKMTLAEAMAAIRQAGGVPVLAHPIDLELDKEALEELVVQLKRAGLMGLEVYYTTHTPEETEMFAGIAAAHDLIITGGSDFHGSIKPGIELGNGYGDLQIDEQLLTSLKGAAVSVRQSY